MGSKRRITALGPVYVAGFGGRDRASRNPMTDLRDQAQAGGPEIVRVSDQPQAGAVTIASSELADADDLTPEGQFPEFGSFLEVETADGGAEYWECPSSLAATIVEIVDEADGELVGVNVDVEEVVKTPSGEWRYVAAVEPPV